MKEPTNDDLTEVQKQILTQVSNMLSEHFDEVLLAVQVESEAGTHRNRELYVRGGSIGPLGLAKWAEYMLLNKYEE